MLVQPLKPGLPKWFIVAGRDSDHRVSNIGMLTMNNHELSAIGTNIMASIPSSESKITNHEAIKYDWSTTSQLAD